MMNEKLSHVDSDGKARMVNVSDKAITSRMATATGKIFLGEKALAAVKENKIKKGDVLGVARVAGIMAIKNTASLIPLCHPLMITGCTVDFSICEEEYAIIASCTVTVDGKTGVEMEALTGVSAALLTIYDMCKAITHTMEISNIILKEKHGGKSGTFKNKQNSKEVLN
jgi:molybdenum cofactor biosynthesis protein MoaC